MSPSSRQSAIVYDTYGDEGGLDDVVFDPRQFFHRYPPGGGAWPVVGEEISVTVTASVKLQQGAPSDLASGLFRW